MKTTLKAKLKKGRPVATDPVKSYTVSLKLSEQTALIKKYGSLTNAIKTAMYEKV